MAVSPATQLRVPRLVAATSASMVTLVAVMGGLGWLPETASGPTATRSSASSESGAALTSSTHEPAGGATDPVVGSATDGAADATTDPATSGVTSTRFTGQSERTRLRLAGERAVPPDSGDGRRVVFAQGAQRVWLVGENGKVRRTYLVSGSVEDNLDPGSYEVYSRSEDAFGINDSGTMKFMVRFTTGDHAAIGFHDLPIKNDRLVQTKAQLGTPRSHGCIRQWRPDAKALWAFAPLGTDVEVVA